MTAAQRGNVPGALTRLRERLDLWRSGRQPGERIPDRFWREAARLAARHGVSRTANCLGVSYYTLKERAESAPVSSPIPVSHPAFVELISTVPSNSTECLIEFEDGSRRIRVHWKGCQGADVVALGRLFREDF